MTDAGVDRYSEREEGTQRQWRGLTSDQPSLEVAKDPADRGVAFVAEEVLGVALLESRNQPCRSGIARNPFHAIGKAKCRFELLKCAVGDWSPASLGLWATLQHPVRDLALEAADDLGRDLGDPEVAEHGQEMDTPEGLVAFEGSGTAHRTTSLPEIGHVLLVKAVEGHRPATSESREVYFILEASQEPAGFFACCLNLFESHVGVEIRGDMEAGTSTHSHLDDGPANPEAWPVGLFQDVEIAFSLVGEVAECSADDIEVDAGYSGTGGAARHG